MFLNTLHPAKESRPVARRVGRGIGSTLGKTCGKGHKGQKARAGGYHKVGFEGGQMPLQRRLPKVGFRSLTRRYTSEVRLAELGKITGGMITLQSLKYANVIPRQARSARIIDSGIAPSGLSIVGVTVTNGARNKIEAAGGKIEV